MTHKRSLIVCTLAVAVVALGLVGFGVQRLEAQANGKAAKTAVAVVNVAEVIAKCKKNVDFQSDMTKRQTKLQIEAKEKDAAIGVMRLDLDQSPNAKAKQALERKIIEAIAEFRAWQQIQQEIILRDQRIFLIELYGEVDETLAAVAEREGYDLVLFDTPSPNFDQLNPDQLVNAIGNRRVLYRAERVSLTPLVLEQLNLDHADRGN